MRNRITIWLMALALLVSLTYIYLSGKNRKYIQSSVPITEVDLTQAETIKIELDSPQINKVSEFFQEVTYLPLELTEHSKIIETRDLVFTDDMILVWDGKGRKIVGFDHKGKYLFNIYKKGASKKEYGELTNFTYDKEKNQIIIVSYDQILWYDLDANYVRSFQTNYARLSAVALLSDSRIASFNGYGNSDNSLEAASLNIIDENGELLSRYLPFNRAIQFSIVRGLYDNMSSSESGHLFALPYSRTIYFLPHTGELQAKYELDFGRANLPIGIEEAVFTNIFLSNSQANSFLVKNNWGKLVAVPIENDAFVFIPFEYQGQRFHAYYDKHSKAVKYHNVQGSNDVDGNDFYAPMTTFKESFVSWSTANQLKGSVKKGLVKDSTILKQINQLQPNDNPVLRFVKMKDF